MRARTCSARAGPVAGRPAGTVPAAAAVVAGAVVAVVVVAQGGSTRIGRAGR